MRVPSVFDETVSILENRKVNEKYWKLSFDSSKLASGVLPGQFMNIRLEENSDPFLRRPFSYYRTKGNRVEILYEVLGRGTSYLASKRRGDTLKVLGPLGKPFTQEIKGRKRVLIAGGVGLPPLVFLAERVSVDYLLIGCKSAGEVLPKKELAKVKADVRYATEDGSYGKKGVVTVLLNEILKQEKNVGSLFIQACGPRAMLDAMMKTAVQSGIQGEASMDERMACGIGACLGCVVKTRDGYKTSCVDGPVFSFGELEV